MDVIAVHDDADQEAIVSKRLLEHTAVVKALEARAGRAIPKVDDVAKASLHGFSEPLRVRLGVARPHHHASRSRLPNEIDGIR